MFFRAGPTNHITRIFACLVLLGLGGMLFTLLSVPGMILGSILMLFAFGVIVSQGVLMWRERRDPYDLSRLWDKEEPPIEPEEDADERNLVYCHRCNTTLPDKFSICPECGNVLGH